MAWAYAVADARSAPPFRSPRFLRACAAAEEDFLRRELRQLYQWQLWRDECGGEWPGLPEAFHERCRAAFLSGSSVESQLQTQVVTRLSAIGLEPRTEVRTPHGYSLDAVVHFEGRDVAVEVDGPTHFVGRMPTSVTALKRRQLRAAGWALLPVPYWEWDALGSQAAKQEYLKRALEGLGEP